MRKTWGILNGLLGRSKKSLPDSFIINGNSVSDSQQIADGFNEYNFFQHRS